jgi:hypothetical protein
LARGVLFTCSVEAKRRGIKMILYSTARRVTTMALKEKLNLLRDLLEHMGTCCDEWQAADGQMETLFASSLRRDLAEFRRLCDSLLVQQPISPVARTACS